MKRSEILDVGNGHSILKDGALIIEATIQVKDELDNLHDPKEKKAHRDKGLQLLKNQEISDLSVRVGGKWVERYSMYTRLFSTTMPPFFQTIASKRTVPSETLALRHFK